MTELERTRGEESLFRQAPMIEEAGFGTEDEQVAHMVYKLAQLLSEVNPAREAEAGLELGDIQMASTFHPLAGCLMQSNRLWKRRRCC